MILINKIQKALKSDPSKYLKISKWIGFGSLIVGLPVFAYSVYDERSYTVPESVENVQKLTREVEWGQITVPLKTFADPSFASFADSMGLYFQNIESSIDSIVADSTYQNSLVEYEKFESENQKYVTIGASLMFLSIFSAAFHILIDEKYDSIIREQRTQEKKQR